MVAHFLAIEEVVSHGVWYKTFHKEKIEYLLSALNKIGNYKYLHLVLFVFFSLCQIVFYFHSFKNKNIKLHFVSFYLKLFLSWQKHANNLC